MASDRYAQAEWLELSGLPLELNRLRQGAWLVFKKLAELDCDANRRPGEVEITVAELAARCGLEADKAARILELLQRKRRIRCYLPEHPEEEGIFAIRSPVKTPIPPERVAETTTNPFLRDLSNYRYARQEDEPPVDERKVQEAVDCYLNMLSTRMNVFILEQIEIAVRRFPLELVKQTIERAARHDIRSMKWVFKELIRDTARQEKKSPRDEARELGVKL
ncbi:MAG TPA: hypothetical protein PK847_06790 [Candidatus Sumerlaeota bacterium]|nr:MAG: hypothetical protein BWZ08_02071 [candidate division BRC1 bacterium ADurb.BinA292]HOE96277.1 hypothetical protein [Candidatus Sumerlaeota bacterium]HOR27521.1 hypothetical protein [Candidatus Sumerlaeota bacterium]